MKIIALTDPEAIPEDDPRLEGKSKDMLQEMEFHVVEDLRLMDHEVVPMPFGPDVVATIQTLKDSKADLVFNLTEHYKGDRRQDMNIAALLDLIPIPYTGTGPEGLMLCRDKATCKRILSHHRIHVPGFSALAPGRLTLKRKLKYPLLVKPVYEDGSDGISLASLVHSEKDMQDRARMIHERMKQPAICEEFIEGRELYVGVLGNARLQTLPAREVRFGSKDEGGPVFATSRVKLDEEYRDKWKIEYGHAGLSEETEKRVGRVAKRIYRFLRIRDYGRIDMRLTPEGDIYFLEANPNPELTMGDELAEAAARVGIDHSELIKRIVNLALRRYR